MGEALLRTVPELADVHEVVMGHHERFDGSGYPRGLQGADIPLTARILAVADAYSAMISDRPYRKALSEGEAIAELRKGAGTDFDPDIVSTFIRYLNARRAAPKTTAKPAADRA
jgi:HD-GYP domain-containing protein (c-di-GMP phosphodiesterase class II)